MSMKKLRNHVHRNGFDLSRRNAFTAKVGELLPVLCEEVIPGDKFKIKPEWFTRTRPLNTAAYTRVREYYDFYFVPYRLLWKGFDNFITQMENPVSAASILDAVDNTTSLPHTDMYQLVNYLQKLKAFANNESVTNNDNKFDEVGLNRFYSTIKLLNYLNYGSMERILDDYANAPSTSYMPNMELNVFPLLAYQKIYQDYFRDSQWEKAAPYTWNVDYVGSRQTSSEVPIAQIYVNWTANRQYVPNMLDLRYCNWNKDMFFGLLPSPQFGDESFAPIGINNTLEAITKVDNTTNYNSMSNAASGNALRWQQRTTGREGYINANPEGTDVNYIYHGHTASTSLVGNVTSNGLSILALRQAEALQKWKEISLSGSQDFRAQMKKHWGVDVGESRSNRCHYIGGSVSNVSIGEVVNQNITSDNIADIAGKGVGNGSGSIDFKSDDYGIVMCIYHAVPLLDYESIGLKRFNTKITAQDFAIPEFDSVGMQQVMNYQMIYGAPSRPDGSSTPVPSVFPLGYAPRYLEYKTAVDEIHGGFMSMPKDYIEQQGFPAWVAPINYDWMQKFTTTDYKGLSYVDFKIHPTVLDPIFSGTIKQEDEGSVKYDASLSTDQLLCNAFFDFKAVRNLDYDGLPY